MKTCFTLFTQRHHLGVEKGFFEIEITLCPVRVTATKKINSPLLVGGWGEEEEENKIFDPQNRQQPPQKKKKIKKKEEEEEEKATIKHNCKTN